MSTRCTHPRRPRSWADRLAEQERAVLLARSAAAEVEAPAALRARIEAQRRARRMPVSRRVILVGASATARPLAPTIGTFNEGRNVTLWARVSPKVFTTLTVTREQTDGDKASSGEKVLVGTVTTGG